MNYNDFYQRYLLCLNDNIEEISSKPFANNSQVRNAALYSLLSGGKRIRGVLVQCVSEMLNGNENTALHYAVAIEMLHCYSLIHDDLPCMDNDDLRRGKPSCHKAFNEENALLAGDALLTGAFEVIASAPSSDVQCKNAVLELACASGASGMIYGQELDLAAEHNKISLDELLLVHKNKTGQLIACAVTLGAISANAQKQDVLVLKDFAFKLGLAFQIIDDVLDQTSTAEQLGKPVGSDKENEKNTFVSIMGIDKSREYAKAITKDACEKLTQHFGAKSEFLILMAQSLLERNN